MRFDVTKSPVRRLGALPFALALALAGCEIEDVAIPSTPSRLALHGVLSASADGQLVLLERVRNGTVSLFAPPFDLYPFVHDDGIAETGAQMRLTTPSGEVLIAREESSTRGDRTGEGIYRFALPGSALARGGTYRLSVTTFQGETLTAEATVPGGVAALAAEPGTFDRAGDTLALAWEAVPGARSYHVRVETPFGPRTFFTDSTRVRLPGMVRNVDEEALQRVFIPGFQQAVTVSAVDSNFYDWYRTQNNVFTGTGVINRVRGGIGVFGSLVRLRFQDLHVVAPQPQPVAGRFEFVGTFEESRTTPFLALELYVESPAQRADQADALSGRYQVRPRFGYDGCLTCGLLGSARGTQLQLALLADWAARDTTEVFTGEVRGDTIVGSYRGFGGIVRFVRRR